MGQIRFRGGNLLDVAAGELRPGCDVLLEGDRIAEVSDREIRAPEALRLDAAGRTLMPGLIDAHFHAAITTLDLAAMERRPPMLVAQEARRVLDGMLARGFTSVRDAGGADWGLAEAVERGLVRGPRLFFSGRVLSQTGGHGDFRPRVDAPELCACRVHSSAFSHVADGVPAVRRAERDAGVRLGFGTDLLGELHEQQSRELQIRAQVLPPAEILRQATLGNAEILNRTGELGVVAPGAKADLLVVDGDPLRDFSRLEGQGKHLDVVMKDGALFVNRLAP